MNHHRKRRGSKNFGLFPRLVAAFIVVGIGSVTAAGGAVYLSARDVLLRDEQENQLADFDRSIRAFFEDGIGFHEYDPAILNSAHDILGTQARIEIVGGSQSGGDLPAGKVPVALRDVVGISDGTHFQRVQEGTQPVFYIGRRIPLADASIWTRNGIQIFVAYHSTSTKDLALATAGTSLLIALLSAGAGIFTASRLVRPLRRLTGVVDQMKYQPNHDPIPVQGWGEIATLTRSLNETSHQLGQSIRDLRDSEAHARRFVADVSHELRTPVAALVALTEVLPVEQGVLSKPQARAVSITQGEVIRLARLVDDLIEISRFDAGRSQTRNTFERLAELTAQGIASRGWDVELDLDESIELDIDARRWDLVIANLVSNALRHGKPPVTVSLAEVGSNIVLTVTNHGKPIPAEALPHICERFYKVDSARTRSEGSGLGLAITAENVNLLGGTIHIDSAPHATQFIVALPCHDVQTTVITSGDPIVR